MTTAAQVTGRPAPRPGGAGRCAPRPRFDDRRALQRVDWGAPSAAAFYRSLEAALEASVVPRADLGATGPSGGGEGPVSTGSAGG